MHCGARHVLPPRYPTAKAAGETAAPRQLRQQGKNSMSQLVTIKGAHRSLRVPTPLAAFSLFPGGNEKRRKGQLHPPAMPAVRACRAYRWARKADFVQKYISFCFSWIFKNEIFSGGNKKRRKGQLHPPAMPAVCACRAYRWARKADFVQNYINFCFSFSWILKWNIVMIKIVLNQIDFKLKFNKRSSCNNQKYIFDEKRMIDPGPGRGNWRCTGLSICTPRFCQVKKQILSLKTI